ncbi:MAG TPA: FixH family protein [Terriglobales bacterium]|nr:FixH family protein [Terriglobales bacterium]
MSEFTVEREFTPLPVQVGPVRVTFTVRDRASKPVEDAHISVEADMSHAGMSPVFAEAKEIQPGRYQADLALGMAGDWVILLHGTLASGEKLERQFDMKGVQPRALN